MLFIRLFWRQRLLGEALVFDCGDGPSARIHSSRGPFPHGPFLSVGIRVNPLMFPSNQRRPRQVVYRLPTVNSPRCMLHAYSRVCAQTCIMSKDVDNYLGSLFLDRVGFTKVSFSRFIAPRHCGHPDYRD